jgi:hypothetical protein
MVSFYFLSLVASSVPLLATGYSGILSSTAWETAAAHHERAMDTLLYPAGSNLKSRTHLVREHPIYNFLHTYYRYSAANLRKYSPGIEVLMENGNKHQMASYINDRLIERKGDCFYYDLPDNELPDGPYGWVTLSRNRDILTKTESRAPFFGCFGLHEWAMLYSGRVDPSNKVPTKDRHQKHVPLRVAQDVIDSVVETSSMRCTHYDAYRFFHPVAQGLNSPTPLSRSIQAEYEQPGCVHAAMDLFKYAYQLYPFLPSELLRDCLSLALEARKIDMRASPYDVSNIEDCGPQLCIETAEGRKAYSIEQEALAAKAAPVRRQLIEAYDVVLSRLSSSKQDVGGR